MKLYHFHIIWTSFILCCVLASNHESETEAEHFMLSMDEVLKIAAHDSSQAAWEFSTNMTKENSKNQIEESLKMSKLKQLFRNRIKQYNWNNFKNETLKRICKQYSRIGTGALDEDDLRKFQQIVADMKTTYSSATICDYFNKTKCDLPLTPDITKIIAESRNPDQLKYTWMEWYNASGRPVRDKFIQYVDLMNKAARLNNLTNAEEMWLEPFEDNNLKDKINSILRQISPLYSEIHAYVRYKLRQKYGEEIVGKRQPIPEYLLGDVWAQTWVSILDIVMPYPDAPAVNITDELVKQGYTPLQMFKTAEEFYTSLNMPPMTEDYWNKSMFVKPKDTEAVCHPSAWDLAIGQDFRVKMCTEITARDFYTIHHEMGHTEYHMLYRHLPYSLRGGANSGFHEAVGDAIALSVSTPKHLKTIGLYKGDAIPSTESRINQLMETALKKFVFLPYGFLIDSWRWDVFSGKIKPEEYNCKFWDKKVSIQGVVPPEPRSEEYFDPAGKYHVAANVPYVRYFISHILQFQFHKAMCIKANQYSPKDPTKALDLCDIYGSKEAGNAFKSMLSLGASKPWPDALEVLTGVREMDASPLLEYFEKLYEWLKKENAKNNEEVGWDIPKDYECPSN